MLGLIALATVLAGAAVVADNGGAKQAINDFFRSIIQSVMNGGSDDPPPVLPDSTERRIYDEAEDVIQSDDASWWDKVQAWFSKFGSWWVISGGSGI
jgi:hypothetical protein